MSLDDIQLYPLTQAQQRIWNTELLYPNTSVCILAGAIKIEGQLHRDLLEQAINLAVQQHDAFRIMLINDQNEMKQYFETYSYQTIDYIDFSANNDERHVDDWLHEHKLKPMQLIQSALYHFLMFKTDHEQYGYCIKIHHIIADGISLEIITNQITSNYFQLLSNNPVASHEPKSYIDYISAEQDYRFSDRFQQDRNYWINTFDTLPAFIEFKAYQPILSSTAANRASFTIKGGLYQDLKQFCQDQQINVYAFFLSVLYTYIHKVSNEQDMAIGAVYSNRSTKKEKGTMGMYASTVAARIAIDPEEQFGSFLQRVSLNLSKIMLHQKYPYNQLIQDLRVEHHNIELQRLFSIIMEYRVMNFLKSDQTQNDKKLASQHHFCGHEVNDLLIRIEEELSEHVLHIHLDYRTCVFEEHEINKLIEYMSDIVRYIIGNSQQKISTFFLIHEEEKQIILNEFNDTTIAYPQHKTIQQLFEEQVQRTPDRIAVAFEGQTLTYQELNEKSNQVARALRAEGVKVDQLVGIMVERSLEMMIGMLGILKAGGAYVPIDPEYPQERIHYILNDSNVDVLLLQHHLQERVSYEGKVITLEGEHFHHEDRSNLPHLSQPNDLAYVIYTSGTTGKPKGAMIEHRNVVRLVKNTNSLPLNDQVRILQTGSIVFDASTFEIWGAMLNGGQLHLTEHANIINAVVLKQLINTNDINLMFLSTALFNQLVQQDHTLFERLQTLIVGGEELSIAHANKLILHYPTINLINGYGPTENTTFSTTYPIHGEQLKKAPIGRPISNSTAYIVDQGMNLQPIGVYGELIVGGDGVARGYLNQPELTAQKFVNGLFKDGERCYRTGDLARWLPDGNIEFLGRMDHQVKIRGYRIELGEVETSLLSVDCVQEATVATHEVKNGEKVICAYYVAKQSHTIHEIKAALSEKLPSYMIPTYFVELDQIPLTPNGKVDRKSLPAPESGMQMGTEYVPPQTPAEIIMSNVWEETLGLEKVGITDSFFDLGGHSLKIIETLPKLTRAGLQVTIKDYYDLKTIAAITSKISGEQPEIRTDEQVNEMIWNKPPKKRLTDEQISKPFNHSGHLLLTGATGYLGAHLLEQLLRTTDCTITCIIRGHSDQEVTERLVNKVQYYFKNDDVIPWLNQRVSVRCGDLSQPNLGLAEAVYNDLKVTVTEVIHAAALTKHFGTQEEFTLANVSSVEQLLKFVGHDKKFHHTSTISVSGLQVDEDEDVLFTEHDFYIKQDYLCNVYIETKFLAEKLIYDYVSTGTDAVIYRIGNLTNRYTDGQHQQNMNENSFLKRLKFMIKYGVITDLFPTGLEFTPVDKCSEAMLNIITQRGDSAEHYVFHLSNDKTLETEQFIEMLDEHGYKVELMKQQRFEQIVALNQEDEQFNQELQFMMGYGSDVDVHSRYRSKVNIDSTFTKQRLAQLQWHWPDINQTYINQVLQHMFATGYIRKEELQNLLV
ncbi:non-ribosomal peptide synthetase [Paenibacillus sp. 481]|uniref:non-ribosomal peptide synthetase n=1 Tax=Paenibacillus sp. 481 TaxID=2835869 RepID=UPI001E36CD14|nr:non-ribosomal peptide synthetase [Paenibacillus sp. 481]UHA72038.1 amino acid adenylation domain-containing protein [Paenibacillus sp. 481]